MHSATFLPLPSVRRGGGLGESFELSYDPKNGCTAIEGGWGGVFVFSSFMSIFLSFFSKLLSDTARVFKYLLQGDQEVLQTACGTL